jgi:cell division protein FtsW
MKHFIILFFGLIIMFIASRVPYSWYSRPFKYMIFFAIAGLIYTIFKGAEYNEARRAIKVTEEISFQVADFAKLSLIIYLARYLSKNQDRLNNFKSLSLYVMAPIFAICGLILPNNLSTAFLLFMTCIILLFIGRVKIKYLFSIIGIGLVAGAIFIGILYNLPEKENVRVDTWRARIQAFFNPTEEVRDQVIQAKIAIARGGVLGVGPGNSSQKNFLPLPYSDYIYALILEEYGLIVGSVVALLYCVFLFRAIRLVTKIPRNFGAFLAAGVSLGIVFQALINMGVAVNLLPVTGQPLPLVSKGGTSIWFTSLAIGIILSISREIEEGSVSDPENPEGYETETA